LSVLGVPCGVSAGMTYRSYQMKNGGDVTDVIHLVNISGTPPARIDRDRLDVFRLDQPTSIQRRVCRTGLSNGSVERVCEAHP